MRNTELGEGRGFPETPGSTEFNLRAIMDEKE